MAKQDARRSEGDAAAMGQGYTADTERLMREDARQWIPSYSADETSYLRRTGSFAQAQQSNVTGTFSADTGYYRPPDFRREPPEAPRARFDELNESSYGRIFGTQLDREPHGDLFDDSSRGTLTSGRDTSARQALGQKSAAAEAFATETFGKETFRTEDFGREAFEKAASSTAAFPTESFAAEKLSTQTFAKEPFAQQPFGRGLLDAEASPQPAPKAPFTSYGGRREQTGRLFDYGFDSGFSGVGAQSGCGADTLPSADAAQDASDSLVVYGAQDDFRYDGDDDGDAVQEQRTPRRAGKADAARRKKNRLVLAVAAVMVLLAVALGVFLTDRFISPMMLLSTEEKTDEAVISPDIPPQADADAADATAHAAAAQTPQGVQQEVTIPAWSVYLVQAGAFSQAQNADQYAQTIRDMGGAGYVLTTDYHRVIATAFNSEYDAEQVRSTLAAQVSSAQIYELSFGQMTFSVTAEEEDMEVITSALAQWPELIKSLMTMIRKTEAGEISSQEALVSLMEIQAQLDSAAESLEGVAGARQSELVGGLCDMYAEAARILADVAAQKNVTPGATLSRVKYAHIGMCWNYRMLVENVAQQQTQQETQQQDAQ